MREKEEMDLPLQLATLPGKQEIVLKFTEMNQVNEVSNKILPTKKSHVGSKSELEPGLESMNLENVPFAIGRVFMINRLTSLTKFRKRGVFLL